MSKQSTDRKQLRKFRVLYAVTRSEWYEILAPNKDAACEDAFCDGELVDTGETTNLTECDVEEVPSWAENLGQSLEPCRQSRLAQEPRLGCWPSSMASLRSAKFSEATSARRH